MQWIFIYISFSRLALIFYDFKYILYENSVLYKNILRNVWINLSDFLTEQTFYRIYVK